MGGNHFVKHDPPINTPRMPPEVYRLILEQTTSLLRNYYGRVATAIEAPEKADFGDIDILVSQALERHYNPFANGESLECLTAKLGAVAYSHSKNSLSHFFAVPWSDSNDVFATVEIQYYKDESVLDWALFQSAHADMWTIFGSMVRPLKLVINDKGLHIAIPELEVQEVAKRDRLVLLTSKPAEVLAFFGVDAETYWQPFDTVEDMFEYAASSRFFCTVPNRSLDVKTSVGENPSGGEMLSQGARKDTKKATQRTNFARWKDDFITRCQAEGRYTQQRYTADTMRKEAFKTFAGVEEEYNARVKVYKLAEQAREIKRLIRECVPVENVEGNFRSATVHAFDDIVLAWKSLGYVNVPSNIKPGDDGLWDIEVLKIWITTNWKEIGRKAFAVACEQNRAAMEMKEAARAER